MPYRVRLGTNAPLARRLGRLGQAWAPRPSLSLALAGLLVWQPVAGSWPASYRHAAHLGCRLIGTLGASASGSPTGAGAGKTTPFDVAPGARATSLSMCDDEPGQTDLRRDERAGD